MRFVKTRNTTRLKSSAATATQNDAGHVQSAAPATKTATHLAKTSQTYCACHTKRLSTRYKTRLNVTKCHNCSAKPSNAKFETSKMISSAVWPSRGRLRTVLRTVADGWATSSEHTLNPQTPRVKREPLLRIREKTDSKTNICWMPKLTFRCIPILRRQSNIDQSFQTT